MVVESTGAGAVARASVRLAVRVLPQRDDRLRYRAEFLADLHSLSPAGQLRYTAGVLSQMLALRAALGSTPSRVEEDAMTITRTPFYWRCRVLRVHHWVPRSTDDGGRYEACSRCGCERDDRYDPTGGIGMGAALGTGGSGVF
jgi:hypothetical protein